MNPMFMQDNEEVVDMDEVSKKEAEDSDIDDDGTDDDDDDTVEEVEGEENDE